MDLTQQQQQQQHYAQFGILNAPASPPSPDDELKRYHVPLWKGSGGNLPPHTPKQTLAMLKQASSAINVAQGSMDSRGYLGYQTNESVQYLRKGSMFNLRTNESLMPTALQRKSSMYTNLNQISQLNQLGQLSQRSHMNMSSMSQLASASSGGTGNLMRKGSIYSTGNVYHPPQHTNSTSNLASAEQLMAGMNLRKGSMYNISNSDNVTLTRKDSIAGSGYITGGLGGRTGSRELSSSDYNIKLGPGQIHPKGYRLTSERYGELKMGFQKIKGVVEVEVIQARNIAPADCETPPDTYVKCYIKDGDRLRHKKKTRVVRHSLEPLYKQTLKYQSADVFGRNIVIMVWRRCMGFEHNQDLGGTEVNLDKINVQEHVGGWYPLFPMHSYGGSDSDNSP